MSKTRPCVILLAAALAACGGTDPEATGRNVDSPIAGSTLRCADDYPDSALVFGTDGTLSGRYAGQPVTGTWTAAGSDIVDVHIMAGGLSVRDTFRRTASGWRGSNTSCG